MSEQKGLSILFAKRYPTKQGVFRAEQAQARENDYATGEGNEKSHPRNQQKTHFCLPTKVRFLNDVCLRQMMLATPNDVRYANDVCLTAH